MDDYASMESFFRGFMVDQRGREGAKATAAVGASSDNSSKRELFAGTRPGTNGLRGAVSEVRGAANAGDDAVQGAGGV